MKLQKKSPKLSLSRETVVALDRVEGGAVPRTSACTTLFTTTYASIHPCPSAFGCLVTE